MRGCWTPKTRNRMMSLLRETVENRRDDGAEPANPALLCRDGSADFRRNTAVPWVKGALYVDRHGGIASCCMVKDTAKYGLGKVGLTPMEAGAGEAPGDR